MRLRERSPLPSAHSLRWRRDEEGGKFADLDGAVHEAIRSIRSLACGDIVAGTLHLDLSIEICDGGASPLQMVSFEHAVTIRGDTEG